MITFSKLELVKRCSAVVVLPHTEAHAHEVDAGKELHAGREADINAGDIPDVFRERWPDMTWRAEVKLAYDIATGVGRELGQGTDRDYSDASPFEICGTADAVGMGPGKIVVVDFKSFDPNVTRPQQNAQLHIAALALSRAHGIDDVEVAIHHEVRPFEVAALDVFNLDAFALEVRAIFENAAKARAMVRDGLPLAVNPGKWCRWCPAFDACPKQRELTAMVQSNAAEAQVELLLPLRDDDNFAIAYELRERLSMLLKRLNASLIAAATERPRPIGNGRMFGKVQTQGNEKLDGDVVYDVLRARYGQHIADAAVERTASKKRIREALALKGGKGQVAEMERAVLDEVRAKGGSKRETKTAIEEFPAALQAAG